MELWIYPVLQSLVADIRLVVGCHQSAVGGGDARDAVITLPTLLAIEHNCIDIFIWHTGLVHFIF